MLNHIRASTFPVGSIPSRNSDMDPTPASPQPPPSATTNYLHSIESNTDSWAEDHSLYQSAHGSTASAASLGSIKLRLMCSNGGQIVPRPHDKSLCYVGGETRIVVVDRQTTLVDLTHRLSKTIFRSSPSSTATSTAAPFTIKYQLPSEDLDSLISVTTDEDLENMIEEYERLNSSSAVSKSPRIRLFIFPTQPESVSSIDSFLENSKSEDWFLNALNGTTSGFSDTSSVNNLLGLNDEISHPEKKDVNHKGHFATNLRGINSGQDIHSIPDSPMMETTSSFGSATSTPSLANLPPIRINEDDHPKVIEGGVEEQFSQMSVQQRHQKHQDDGGFVAAPASAVVSGSPMSSATAIPEQSDPFLSYHERSEQGLEMAYLKHQQQQQHQQQFQQKQSTGLDLSSADSVLSDRFSRQNPPMTYQEPVVQIQDFSNNNRVVDPNDTPDQNTRIQMQQQHHPQLHHQQVQFMHTAVPPQQYIHHHPSGAVPASYYQMYQPQGLHHPAMSQQNLVYYMPNRQPPQGYNFQLQQQQPASPTATTTPPNNQTPPPSGLQTTTRAGQAELPAGVYRTTNSGSPGLIQVSSGHQHQPPYGYSEVHHPSQFVGSSASGGGGNYAYEFTDSSRQGQHVYYATQPMPPQSAAQYQTMASTSPVDVNSQLATDNNTRHQQQQQM